VITTTYLHASDFLARVRAELERHEVLNSLPLGIALHLQKFPEHIETPPYLATVEEEGKLVVAAVMTPPVRLIIASNQGDGFDAAFALLIHNLREQGRAVPGVIGPAALSNRFVQAWSSQTGEAAYLRIRERLFELTHVITPRSRPGSLRLATLDETALVGRWFKDFEEEALHTSLSEEEAIADARTRIGNGEVYFWVLPDGAVVSMAGTARPVSRVISVNSVYTPPEQRGHGYASRMVATLSQHLLDSGWERCTLFTDLSNPTSNTIYQQIGYQPVQDFHVYDFSRTSAA